MDREEEQKGRREESVSTVAGLQVALRKWSHVPGQEARSSSWSLCSRCPRGRRPGPCSVHPRLEAPTQPQGHKQGHVREGVP